MADEVRLQKRADGPVYKKTDELVVWANDDGTLHTTDEDGTDTALGAGGGGGSLPDWWTVDSTPGGESVGFAGQVVVTPNVVEGAIVVDAPAGFVDTLNDGIMFGARMQGGSQNWGTDYVYKFGVLDMRFKSPPDEGTANLFIEASDIPNAYAQVSVNAFRIHDGISQKVVITPNVLGFYGTFSNAQQELTKAGVTAAQLWDVLAAYGLVAEP